MQEKFTPQKVILWNPDHFDFGLGDRLRGIAGGVVFAQMKGAKLLVGAPTSQACPVPYEELFEANEEFSISSEIIDIDAYKKNDKCQIIAEWNHKLNMMPAAHYRFLQEIDPFPLTLKEFNAQLRPLLRRLVPTPSIQSELESLQSQTHPKLIGVHLRRTDVMQCQSKLITSDNVEQFDDLLWQRLLSLIDSVGYTQVYIASDDKTYFTNWQERITNLNIEVLHYRQSWSSGFRQTSLDGLIVDMYMMAKCDQVIGSVPSSLFVVGRALGGKYDIVQPLDMERKYPWQKPGTGYTKKTGG